MHIIQRQEQERGLPFPAHTGDGEERCSASVGSALDKEAEDGLKGPKETDA